MWNISEVIQFDDYHHFNRRYQKACRMVAKYCKLKEPEPSTVRVSYNQALYELRAYLDAHGVTFPPPRYCYDKEDKNTWKYLDRGHAINPEFKY